MNQLIDSIIQQLKDIQYGKLWIGSSYSSKLNQLDESMVFTRPIDGLHSIAEIISHLTLWRKETILKIETGTGSKTDECEENWLSINKLKLLGWKKIKLEYDESLVRIIDLLKFKDDLFLNERYYDTDFKDHYNYSFVIYGMIHHDIYHLGQIGIIIKFLEK